MRLFHSVLALSLLSAAPALAQVAPAAETAAEPKTAVTEKKICRRDEGVGSRLNRKICLTRQQWVERAKAEAGDGDRDRDPSASEGEPR